MLCYLLQIWLYQSNWTWMLVLQGLVLSYRNMTRWLIIHYTSFSRKFHQHKLRYSTIHKETLVLLLALQHLEVYVRGHCGSICSHTPFFCYVLCCVHVFFFLLSLCLFSAVPKYRFISWVVRPSDPPQLLASTCNRFRDSASSTLPIIIPLLWFFCSSGFAALSQPDTPF